MQKVDCQIELKLLFSEENCSVGARYMFKNKSKEKTKSSRQRQEYLIFILPLFLSQKSQQMVNLSVLHERPKQADNRPLLETYYLSAVSKI